MECPRCRSSVEREWEFCSKCGTRLGRSVFDFGFGNIFSRMQKELKEMDKLFDKDIEAFDISPWFGKPKSKGFTIKIITHTGKQPVIDIKTFGGVDEENLRKQIYSQLGISRGFREIKPQERPLGKPLKTPIAIGEIRQKSYPTPKITEEPKTDVRRLDSKVVVDMEMPGVKSGEDIEIRALESSIEVKAIAGDKAYFKIFTKPPQYRLTGKKFDKGVLHLEFS